MFAHAAAGKYELLGSMQLFSISDLQRLLLLHALRLALAPAADVVFCCAVLLHERAAGHWLVLQATPCKPPSYCSLPRQLRGMQSTVRQHTSSCTSPSCSAILDASRCMLST